MEHVSGKIVITVKQNLLLHVTKAAKILQSAVYFPVEMLRPICTISTT